MYHLNIPLRHLSTEKAPAVLQHVRNGIALGYALVPGWCFSNADASEVTIYSDARNLEQLLAEDRIESNPSVESKAFHFAAATPAFPNGMTREEYVSATLKADPSLSRDELERGIDQMHDGLLFVSSMYQVHIRKIPSNVCGALAHLSIKRIDKGPIHDWRVLQRIKNELLGPECEAVELYPAESRLVDIANQYHLWGFIDPTFRFPFGFTERLVSDSVGVPGTVQRPHGEQP